MIRHVSLLHLWQVTTGLNQYQKYIYQIVHPLFFFVSLVVVAFFPPCMHGFPIFITSLYDLYINTICRNHDYTMSCT